MSDLNAIAGVVSPYGHQTLARWVGIVPITAIDPSDIPPELLAGMKLADAWPWSDYPNWTWEEPNDAI